MIKLQIKDQSFTQNNLIFRRELAPVRERIIQQIEDAASQSIFFYDFSEIEAINSSGCDELIAKILLHMIESDIPKYLVLRDLSEEYEHANEVDAALKRCEVSVVHVHQNEENVQVEFLGKVSDAHREILEYVYRNKVVTARELAEALDKKPNLMSTQLAQLFKARMIKREEDWLAEGGRQFRYQSLI